MYTDENWICPNCGAGIDDIIAQKTDFVAEHLSYSLDFDPADPSHPPSCDIHKTYESHVNESEFHYYECCTCGGEFQELAVKEGTLDAKLVEIDFKIPTPQEPYLIHVFQPDTYTIEGHKEIPMIDPRGWTARGPVTIIEDFTEQIKELPDSSQVLDLFQRRPDECIWWNYPLISKLDGGYPHAKDSTYSLMLKLQRLLRNMGVKSPPKGLSGNETETPKPVKERLDEEFCMWVNKEVFHVIFAQSADWWNSPTRQIQELQMVV